MHISLFISKIGFSIRFLFQNLFMLSSLSKAQIILLDDLGFASTEVAHLISLSK